MNRNELITAIANGRIHVESYWAGLDESALTHRPGPQPDWSVKDLIAHLTYWPKSLVADVQASLQGKIPPSVANPVPTDDLNARVFAENRDRPLAAILADFHAAIEQVIEMVQALSDEDLNDPNRFDWMSGDPLVQRISWETLEHFDEHLTELRAWREKQSS